MNGYHKFKKLVNRKGFYCEIYLEVTLINLPEVVLEFDQSSKWFSSLNFAVNYFYEGYVASHKGGLKVTVTRINSEIVDTTAMVVFYTALKSLYNAFSLEDHLVRIDADGNFVIPKIPIVVGP